MSRPAWLSVALLFVVGAAIRVSNAVFYPTAWGFDAKFNWEYVELLRESWALRAPDTAWATSHPPLYYYLAGAVDVLAGYPDPVLAVALIRGIGVIAGLASVVLAVRLVQRVDPGNIAQNLCRSAAHRVQIGQIHPNKANLRRRAIFVFQLCHGLRRPLCTAVQHHDRGTFAQQGPRCLKTGPRIGPGDHKGLPLEPANPLRGPAVRAESLVCHGLAPYR